MRNPLFGAGACHYDTNQWDGGLLELGWSLSVIHRPMNNTLLVIRRHSSTQTNRAQEANEYFPVYVEQIRASWHVVSIHIYVR